MESRNILAVCILYLIISNIELTSQEPLNVETRVKRNDGGVNITQLHIWSKVEYRYALVDVYSRMRNSLNRSQEAAFHVQIPETAFMSHFSMVINGTLFKGKVDEKKHDKQYDEAKGEGKTAWQITHHGKAPVNGMEAYEITVNVAASSDVSFKLSYEELLERRRSEYIQRFNIQPIQIVPDLVLRVDYSEPQGFEHFSFRLSESNRNVTASETSVKVRETATTRSIFYKPSVREQEFLNDLSGYSGQFVVTYDVVQKKDGGVMVVKDGCFNHFVAPKDLKTLDKNIVFLVDTSGSMSGDKIDQARNSLLIILDKLKPSDFFNILLFDSTVQSWRSEPQEANTANTEAAKEYVNQNVIASGGTNINDALLEAIRSLKNSFGLTGNRAHLIMFLSDGEPASGITDTKTIRTNVLLENMGEKRIGIYPLAFGTELDYEFLNRLAWDNGGFARLIRNNDDAEIYLTNFFEDIEKAVMKNVEINYDERKVDTDLLTQLKFFMYFDGSEIVAAGKLKENETSQTDISANVIGLVKDGHVTLNVTKKHESNITCKLFNYLKIKDLLKKMAIAKTGEESERFRSQALDLSLQNGFVTPLTSFVVIQGHKVKEWKSPQMDFELTTANIFVDFENSSVSSNTGGLISPSFALYYITLLTATAP